MPLSPPLTAGRQAVLRYGRAWMRAAAAALPRAPVDPGEEPVPEIVVVDGFAGADYPAAEPLSLGVAAAVARLAREGSRHRRARVVMLEEDPAKVAWLAARLDGLVPGTAIGRGDGPAPGLSVVEGGVTALEALAGARDGAPASLLLLDPPTAGHAPFESLREWHGHPRTDVLLRLPGADLRRLAGHRGSPISDLPPRLKRTVEGISALLGDGRRAWLHPWSRALEQGVEAAIDGVAAAYAERAREAGATLVRRVRLPAAGGDDHLVLCTRRPGSALLLNRVMHELRLEGVIPCPVDPEAPVRYRRRAELALFPADAHAPAATDRERVVDVARLGHALAELFAGRSVTYEEILRSRVDTDLFAEEIRQALLALRRDGRALFRALAPDAQVAFPRAGARTLQGASARRRSAGEEGELKLDL